MGFDKVDKLAHAIDKMARQNVRIGLTEYSAATIIRELIHDCPDDYFEYPMKDNRLGVTLVDDAVTVTVSSLITYEPRKLFTQAHELCHVLLDTSYLKTHAHLDVLNPLGDFDEVLPLEQRANHFAAVLLLPDAVLSSCIIEGRSAKWIRFNQCVSLPTIQYRLQAYLENHYLLPRRVSKVVAEEFAKKNPDGRWLSALFAFWKSAENALYSKFPADRVESINSNMASKMFDLSQWDVDRSNTTSRPTQSWKDHIHTLHDEERMLRYQEKVYGSYYNLQNPFKNWNWK